MSAITMADFLRRLGVDPDNLRWQDLAVCSGFDTNLFFEEYESSKVVAEQIDSICAGCPVTKDCYEFGTNNKLTGVFGGFYLENGQPSKKRNEHKLNNRETAMRLAAKVTND